MGSATATVVLKDGEENNGPRPSVPERRPIVDSHGNELVHLSRDLLVERLELEKELYSGLRMIFLCAGLFVSLVSTLHWQTNKVSSLVLAPCTEMFGADIQYGAVRKLNLRSGSRTRERLI
eukprot:1113126-Rhodomonas_salina.4